MAVVRRPIPSSTPSPVTFPSPSTPTSLPLHSSPIPVPAPTLTIHDRRRHIKHIALFSTVLALLIIYRPTRNFFLAAAADLNLPSPYSIYLNTKYSARSAHDLLKSQCPARDVSSSDRLSWYLSPSPVQSYSLSESATPDYDPPPLSVTSSYDSILSSRIDTPSCLLVQPLSSSLRGASASKKALWQATLEPKYMYTIEVRELVHDAEEYSRPACSIQNLNRFARIRKARFASLLASLSPS